jgi:hypothetical protein
MKKTSVKSVKKPKSRELYGLIRAKPGFRQLLAWSLSIAQKEMGVAVSSSIPRFEKMAAINRLIRPTRYYN